MTAIYATAIFTDGRRYPLGEVRERFAAGVLYFRSRDVDIDIDGVISWVHFASGSWGFTAPLTKPVAVRRGCTFTASVDVTPDWRHVYVTR